MAAYVAEPPIAMSNTSTTMYRIVFDPSITAFAGVMNAAVKQLRLNED